MNKFSKALTALATAGFIFGSSAQAETLEIGVLLPSPIADVGWSHALNQGIAAVEEKYGDKVNVSTIENIQEGPDADRIINKTVSYTHLTLPTICSV